MKELSSEYPYTQPLVPTVTQLHFQMSPIHLRDIIELIKGKASYIGSHDITKMYGLLSVQP